MALPRDLVGAVRRLDEAQLRQLMVLARGLLIDTEQPTVAVDDLPGLPSVRYRQKQVRCGKEGCSRCPHGPYWYAHWREEGRKRSQYIGSELPAVVQRRLEALDADRARSAGRAGGPDGHVPFLRAVDGT